MSDLLVKIVEPSLWPTKVRVRLEALRYCEARFGSFLGPKKFFMREGERTEVRVPKRLCLEVGDRVLLGNVIDAHNQDNFPCRWVFGP